MRAMRFEAFGGADVLKVQEIERPQPQPGFVLVRQVATSVNPVDLMIRKGWYPRIGADRLPYLGGRDVSGFVEAVGEGVSEDLVGKAVFGLPDFDRGAFAEFVVLKTSEFARAPTNMDLKRLGSVPLAALTALQGLYDHGGLKAGQRVLILGGSGGVGHFAVQLAKVAGAEVFATASSRNSAFLEKLGADKALSYQTDRLEDAVSNVDLVFDMVGGETLSRAVGLIKPGGRAISAVAAPNLEDVERAGLEIGRFFISEPNAEQFAQIAGLIDAGKLDVTLEHSFNLDDLTAAQSLLEAGGVRGKVGVVI